jgi:hypothetical protein
MPIDLVFAAMPVASSSAVIQVRDDLVPVHVEVDPIVRASAFGTAKKVAVEAAGGGKIVDGKGKMEGRKGHAQPRGHEARLCPDFRLPGDFG